MKKLNEILASSKILSSNEMKEVKGGVSAEEYCKTLRTIATTCELDDGARDGLNYGWIKADCGRYIRL